MQETAVYNKSGKSVGKIKLPDGVFDVSWNEGLVHQAVVAQQANRRVNIAHTKGRGEVRGGGRKPWRQKGTGRARHGSIRSPIWKGGGVTFGPTNERNFSIKINKKMRRKALFSALSQRLRSEDMKVVDDLTIPSGKTKDALSFLNNFSSGKTLNVLLVVRAPDQTAVRAVGNLKVKVLPADSLNIEDVLKYKNVLLDKEAVNVIVDHYKL